MIHGVGRDAARIADAVLGDRQRRAQQPRAQRGPGELAAAAE
ncbi:MAG TPA: hypothetical protein VFS67_04675 [Polyangiaceae bacterium]|jgi:hypothetical protein|nr:hypothetical protein [Polyangiaceae bacterium]